jgi:DNA helicase HerA-like ATPase
MTNPDRDGKIFVGKGDGDQFLSLALANRHGLATGATGTGKTVSLQVLAEGFSRAGVPVFAADIKGDLSGIAMRGEANPELVKRAKDMGFDYEPEAFPVVFWTCLASRVTRSAPRYSRWARFWSRACSI